MNQGSIWEACAPAPQFLLSGAPERCGLSRFAGHEDHGRRRCPRDLGRVMTSAGNHDQHRMVRPLRNSAISRKYGRPNREFRFINARRPSDYKGYLDRQFG
jgi:hypothetical protein